jgi:hypothetical protein
MVLLRFFSAFYCHSTGFLLRSKPGTSKHFLFFSHRLHRQCPSTPGNSAGTTSMLHDFSVFLGPTWRKMTRPPSFIGRSVSIFLVYARHGRELMGCKSPVFESITVVRRDKSTSRRQGRLREEGSGGSLSAKL